MAIAIAERLPSPAGRRIFTVNIHGDIITVTVTHDVDVVGRWINTVKNLRLLRRGLVIGLGVQWSPGGGDDVPADTLQICIGDLCLIYQLNQANSVPNLLRWFLLHPKNKFVGFWNQSDREKLQKTKHRLEMYEDPLDLRNVETNNGENLVNASMEEIVEKWLGYTDVRLDRDISMSDWSGEILSDDQVQQATIDAFCAFKIGKNIKAWKLTREGR